MQNRPSAFKTLKFENLIFKKKQRTGELALHGKANTCQRQR